MSDQKSNASGKDSPETLEANELSVEVQLPQNGSGITSVPVLPVLPETSSFDAEAPLRRDQLRSDVATQPETSAMLTADRLIDAKNQKRVNQVPEGFWQRLVYEISLHSLNLGDSAKVRERKKQDAAISKKLVGGARFVAVLTRKGGVGKTTVTSLLGMALASVRDDRVIAIDANPDRGTLSDRVPKQTRATVRDIIDDAASIKGFTDFSKYVSRDDTRLDVIASDTDPLIADALEEGDYNIVADLCQRFYSVVLTDCGTGIVHSIMKATLDRADSVVIVSGGSVDEARLASETLTWLEANGYSHLVNNAVVAINTATQATQLVKLEEIENHFLSRVRAAVRIPYDEHLAAGSVIKYDELNKPTMQAARDLALLVVEGLPTERPVE